MDLYIHIYQNTCYISLSFLSLYTIGPVHGSVEDFWQMIWDYKCPIIVMLTKMVEDHKVCLKYIQIPSILYIICIICCNVYTVLNIYTVLYSYMYIACMKNLRYHFPTCYMPIL